MKNFSLLFNPFEKISENRLVFLGSVFLIIGSLLAYFFNSRFDNFLHTAPVRQIEFHQPFVDNLLIIACLFFFLFIAGKIIYSKTRAIDILATALIGNSPFYLMSLSNINDLSLKSTEELLTMNATALENIPMSSLIYLSIIGIISIAILVWVFVLLYKGFRTAANAKGTKSVLLFISAIILTITATALIPLNY